MDDGALGVALPAFVRAELEGYLECGLLRRGFARLRCDACKETRLVAFSCKGRGFCPSCLGRRMCAAAGNLVEHVLPPAPLPRLRHGNGSVSSHCRTG
ncbi:MAG TPA: transposase zinc-binding domain-containing protein [Polyangiaceae bacterium]